MAVDDGAHESMFAYRPLELVGGGDGIGRGQRGKTGEPFRVALDRPRELIVDLARRGNSVRRGQLLQSGRGQRQHLNIDPCRIHRGDAPLGQVV